MADGADYSHHRIAVPRLAVVIAVAVILYLAREVFVPLALAMLITFALTPLSAFLRRRGVPMLGSVLIVVALTFSVLGAISLVMVSQLAELAGNLPDFQSNIVTKLDALTEDDGNRLVARLSEMLANINAQIGAGLPQEAAQEPMPVEVVERTSAFDVLQSLLVPLIAPIASTGLVIVVVIFMLLEREALRDRFIRLVGASDIHGTTQLLEDAGSRVARYLLIQLLVNVIYAVPIGLGLWLIGVPNAALWGILTLILRFVPYIGSILSAAFPMFLAFAASPDWSMLIWTGILFAGVELVTSNVIEPYLYGSRTGVSPLAIIVSAIFWTFLWGPLGLVISTPLTVCLVVLGRHIPQFEMFDILFGDEAVLHPYVRLYQRLLSGDPVEATFNAEVEIEEQPLAEYYQDVAIPALLQAQHDRDRGVLTREQEVRVAQAATAMTQNLASFAAEERVEAEAEGEGAPLPGVGFTVVAVGGRWDIDDASAAMLAQAMEVAGATADWRSHSSLVPSRLSDLLPDEAVCVVLCFLDPAPTRASLLHIRRIKRAAPQLRVGVAIWQMPSDVPREADSTRFPPSVPERKLTEASELGADFVVTDFDAAIEAAFRRDAPRKIRSTGAAAPRQNRRGRRAA